MSSAKDLTQQIEELRNSANTHRMLSTDYMHDALSLIAMTEEQSDVGFSDLEALLKNTTRRVHRFYAMDQHNLMDQFHHRMTEALADMLDTCLMMAYHHLKVWNEYQEVKQSDYSRWLRFCQDMENKAKFAAS